MTNDKEQSSDSNSLMKVEIVTPESSFLFENSYMTIMPGSEGEFGVLRGHVPLIASLENGTIVIYNKNMKVTNNIAIEAGFVEVKHDSVLILTNKASKGN
jgi:F-type H+-transporting ATPase subunit epsilon